MKALAMVFCLTLSSAIADDLTATPSIVAVDQASGTLRNAVTMKGEKASEVFVTIYRELDQFEIKPDLLKRLLAQVQGGFHEEDPLPLRPDFEFVIQKEGKGGLGVSVEKDGRVFYRGVREFAKGLFEDDDSEVMPGSFFDKELAATLIQIDTRDRRMRENDR
ncbi:hypothetical protein HNR46_001242 [Haloferula luteola]|uniref:Uncharacterized protein n=1 Tax=Haloferula luteola TaxID=595692 RepID=A0A840V8E4_9BACT|nr:hypothetical protein [Haloferula luteola]MBB5351008.1 hypothetical protein [Haloferula luteola]